MVILGHLVIAKWKLCHTEKRFFKLPWLRSNGGAKYFENFHTYHDQLIIKLIDWLKDILEFV